MRVMIILLLVSRFAVAADPQIELSQAQIYNLGVKLGKLEVIRSVPLLDAPAIVSIPPENEYIVSTTQAGLINEIKASIGDQVQKGQVLATINSPELLTLQLHHLKSVNDLKLARADYARDKKLYKEGVIADRRWLQTKANYHVFVSHLNETRQLLQISGVTEADIKALEKNQQLSSQLKIFAPISGVVLERLVTIGEKAEALAPLFRVANFDKLWLDISIPQQRIEFVQLGDKVQVSNSDVTARIFLLGQHVDPANQTVLVRAEVKTAKDSIRPGQTVAVKIIQNKATLMFQVPNSALAKYAGDTYLFLRTATGFTAKPVQIVGRKKQQTIIAGDLQENDEIAIRGAVALKANFLGLGGDE
ncbi:MAG TPA: efflux RND transporter periplasmic adaptor subunit [Methyloprofundus sp.]|uniref:efflux RND transporter periplasmic adaptor subunit n=1 Tax=Methyloprofundus sp. TaxID=2020875 RepID=UPI001845AD57|nr:efflux RND transporter periplasmic adaptor subunit [Methyloprofundus sp.]HIG65053.1 efflux RND transporter periplasmic adaptor subunit [Methyloprofundus sp.]HIL79173.1 efflux RND transporter periplasmic adaptor subunit [Methylococcales bacterium]